jgi:hypothetical protein
MMISGDLDFEVGGVPAHLTLQSKGFKPIVTSADLASSAKPSADSEELLAVFHDGWGASDKWIKDHYDTVLRLLSSDNYFSLSSDSYFSLVLGG